MPINVFIISLVIYFVITYLGYLFHLQLIKKWQTVNFVMFLKIFVNILLF
jgi:hypothetical protein